jgi:membrane fusion protein (multidrug efflux system)
MKHSISLLTLLLLAFSCGKNEKTQSAPGAPGAGSKTNLSVSSVEGFVAKPSVLTENITASGTLVPSEETELHPEATGRVVRLNLPEGRSVRKGELLLKIFDEDLKSQLRKLETQLKQAEITEQRLAELLKVKGVSQQEYDLATLAVQTIKSDIELLRISIDKTELRAPYDGIIGLRRLSPGAYVTPATAVTTIRAASALKLDFSIPEKYSNLIRVGQSLNFTVEGSPATYSAKVLATEQTIAADTRNLVVRASVNNSKGLLPGTFVEVNLSLGNKTQALLIPNQSIIPQARDKKVILSKGGKALFVTVKTGIRQAGMIEVTEGIQAGDTVCTTGMLFLRPDATVIFSKVE